MIYYYKIEIYYSHLLYFIAYYYQFISWTKFLYDPEICQYCFIKTYNC